MRLSLGQRNRRTLMASILLVAFASCALIPPGFMPAGGRPFSLEICREGLPAGLLAHLEPAHAGMDMPAESMAPHHDTPQGSHHHPPSQSEHCVFGTACSAGPIPHLPLPSGFSSARQFGAIAFSSIAIAVRVVHLPQPRAPPVRLS